MIHNTLRAYFPAEVGNPPVSGFQGTGVGIGMLGRVRGEVGDNTILGSALAPTGGPRFQLGIAVGKLFGLTRKTSGTIDIHGNTVRRVDYGLYTSETHELSIHANRISQTTYGMYVDETVGSSVRSNSVNALNTGLWLTSSASNSVVGNTVSGAGGSCVDDSLGSGTAGTSNHWAHNTATSSTPAGICRT